MYSLVVGCLVVLYVLYTYLDEKSLNKYLTIQTNNNESFLTMNTVQKIYRPLYSLFITFTISQTLPRNIVYYTIHIYAFSLFYHNSLGYSNQMKNKRDRYKLFCGLSSFIQILPLLFLLIVFSAIVDPIYCSVFIFCNYRIKNPLC